MDRTYAFVDESGNSDLDTSKGGSSGFFIVCSILVAEKDLDAAYAQAEALRKRHFQTGEIKSSNLKPKDSDHWNLAPRHSQWVGSFSVARVAKLKWIPHKDGSA